MRGEKRVICCAVMFMLALLYCSGCGRQAPAQESAPAVQQEVLNVYLARGCRRYAELHLLGDDELKEQLEKRLGASIQLHYWDPKLDINLLELGAAGGVILMDDPAALQELGDKRKIRALQTLPEDMDNSVYGRYNGIQYSYVFSGKKLNRQPVLLVAVEKLEAAGIEYVPYTPQAVKTMLLQLGKTYSEPLAVYGIPTEDSYAVLQALFGISPQGGGELYVETGAAMYDKISPAGEEYLLFLKALYEEGVIGENCLSASQYSAGEKLLNNVSVMASFTDTEYLSSFVEQAQMDGISVARAAIPVPEEYLQSDAYHMLMGVVSRNFDKTELAVRFFRELEDMAGSVVLEDPVLQLPEYPLFLPGTAVYPEKTEPLANQEAITLVRYIKKRLDAEIISPYYSKVMVGEEELSNFEKMCQLWRETSISTISTSSNGNTILKFYEP